MGQYDRQALQELQAYYEGRIGDYRRELADLQHQYDRVAADLSYAQQVVDGLDVQVLRDLEFWRTEAGRASAAEKRTEEYADLRLKAVEARELELNRALDERGAHSFKAGWARAMDELEGEVVGGLAMIRYENEYSPFFKLYNEPMEELIERLRVRGENWDPDDHYGPAPDDDDPDTLD